MGNRWWKNDYEETQLSFEGFANPLRLTTDIPLSYLDGRPFTLTARHQLALTWGAPIEEPLPGLFDYFLSETVRYWQRWVKQCDIPPRYQRDVIRSAARKLCRPLFRRRRRRSTNSSTPRPACGSDYTPTCPRIAGNNTSSSPD